MIRRSLAALLLLVALEVPAAVADELDNLPLLTLISRYLALVEEIESRGFPLPGKPEDCPDCEFATVTAQWIAPTEGSPVYVYVMQVETIATTTATSTVLPVPVAADSMRARVSGVDAEGRQGPWSLWGPWHAESIDIGGKE
ncbi:MAG TPA: hypothetical protein PLL30_17825 [Candidatus Krumholzibacteria bacterium]|nr:hypothetical protein [Candidatus Krumholzibacteria bacterium]HPD73638.1 hypothetical protein [Candidatus Krumholzibacteria bacterium]HRY42227.1 hypothetical protein [Candidatus Krumholzibacteria bacterium]